MNIQLYPPLNEPKVSCKKDGILVTACDGSVGYLSFFEALSWRLFKTLPKRFRTQPKAEE